MTEEKMMELKAGTMVQLRVLSDKAEREKRLFTPAEEQRWTNLMRLVRTINEDLADIKAKEVRAREAQEAANQGRYLLEAIRSNPDEAWRTAVHEAGHVVACVVEGYGVENVRIGVHREMGKRPQLWGGACLPKRRAASPFIHMAGPAAELLEFPSHGADWEGRFRGDLANSEKHFSPNSASSYRTSAALRELAPTKRRIARLWPAVKAVADALMKRGSLLGKEAEDIAINALPPDTRNDLRRKLEHEEYQARQRAEREAKRSAA